MVFQSSSFVEGKNYGTKTDGIEDFSALCVF